MENQSYDKIALKSCLYKCIFVISPETYVFIPKTISRRETLKASHV